MKNISIIKHEKFQNTSKYELIEDKIYNDLNDAAGFSTYRIAIEVKKEKFPSKIIVQQLESYFIHIEETLSFEETNTQKYILGGELEDIRKFLKLGNIKTLPQT